MSKFASGADKLVPFKLFALKQTTEIAVHGFCNAYIDSVLLRTWEAQDLNFPLRLDVATYLFILDIKWTPSLTLILQSDGKVKATVFINQGQLLGLLLLECMEKTVTFYKVYQSIEFDNISYCMSFGGRISDSVMIFNDMQTKSF